MSLACQTTCYLVETGKRETWQKEVKSSKTHWHNPKCVTVALKKDDCRCVGTLYSNGMHEIPAEIATLGWMIFSFSEFIV